MCHIRLDKVFCAGHNFPFHHCSVCLIHYCGSPQNQALSSRCESSELQLSSREDGRFPFPLSNGLVKERCTLMLETWAVCTLVVACSDTHLLWMQQWWKTRGFCSFLWRLEVSICGLTQLNCLFLKIFVAEKWTVKKANAALVKFQVLVGKQWKDVLNRTFPSLELYGLAYPGLNLCSTIAKLAKY